MQNVSKLEELKALLPNPPGGRLFFLFANLGFLARIDAVFVFVRDLCPSEMIRHRHVVELQLDLRRFRVRVQRPEIDERH